MTSTGEEKLKAIAAQNHGPVTIGIDVSKAVLDVHLHPDGLRQRFANESAGHATLIGWAASQQPERVIFEPTGAWHRALKTALGRAGLPEPKARLDIRTSIPGLGEITALALLVDRPELGSMDAKPAASRAGLAPVTRQSGQWRGKSFIQGGRAILRQAIYPGSGPGQAPGSGPGQSMPARVAIRFNPPLKAKYDALRAKGKPAELAMTACVGKTISQIVF